MKTILFFLCAISINHSLLAQGFIIYGDKAIGTSSGEGIARIYHENYTHFYLAGHTGADVDGDKTDPFCPGITPAYFPDAWIVKTDLQLNILWDRSFGGSNYEEYIYLEFTADGNLILTCESFSDSSCKKTENRRGGSYDYWLMAFDTGGNYIRDKTFGGSKGETTPQTIRLNSGNYITCGSSNSPDDFDKTVVNWSTNTTGDYWCIKLDSAWNKLWDQVYGGSQGEMAGTSVYNLFSLAADDDDSFVLAGTTYSPADGNISQPSFGASDGWIIKIDSMGNKIWDRRYGGNSLDRLSKIIKIQGGYMVAGFTSSNQGVSVSQPPIGGNAVGDVWVLKLDTAGNKIWDRRYGGSGGDMGFWIDTALGGGYIISGITQSQQGYDLSEPPYSNDRDYWIFKIDTAGSLVWEKRFGGQGTNTSSNFIQMPDSSIYFAGSAEYGTSAVKTDAGKGYYDYWIVHFKYTEGPVGVIESGEETLQLSVFPNPASEIVTLQHAIIKTTGLATVYNVLGEAVQQLTLPPNTTRQQLNIAHLPAGLYLIKVEADGKSGVKRFVRLVY